VEDIAAVLDDSAVSVGAGEVANMLELAGALLASALARTESRGSHLRREYPDADPSWRRRLVHGQAPAGVSGRP
jgi:L-aspartate oxidase